MFVCTLNSSSPSRTLISKVSAMLLPLYSTRNVAWLKRRPAHSSQVTYTSGKKCIST